MIKAVIFDMFETLITHYKSPLYFGKEMSEDANISYQDFQKIWRTTDFDRTIGKLSFSQVIEQILKENHVYSDKLLNLIVEKRIKTKETLFTTLHNEIIPMLQGLKSKNIKVGVISNCYDEEASVIRKSNLFPFFDCVCLSCEIGIAKPDFEIYHKCMDTLEVLPKECLYIGDGGSEELETAASVGMNVAQATWYFCNHPLQCCVRKKEFEEIKNPMEILKKV